MTGVDQAVAWSALAGLVIAVRLLDTRPGRRFLGPRIRRLADWWVARQRAAPAVDEEYDQLATVLRRQQLSASVERLRRIVATDESMSATRQIANRIAYNWLLHELEKTSDVLPWITDEDITGRWSPSVLTTRPLTTYASRRPPEAEILEIGWRH